MTESQKLFCFSANANRTILVPGVVLWEAVESVAAAKLQWNPRVESDQFGNVYYDPGGQSSALDRKDQHQMPDKETPPDDVLQSHEHNTLSAEAIAKALARHNRDHKGDEQTEKQAQDKAKKSGKK